VRETQDNQVADTAPVTVNQQGSFDLNGRTDTVDDLTVIGGSVATGAGGKLTVKGVSMTGGTVAVGTGGTVKINGNITATSVAGGSAVISWPAAGLGTLDLNG